MEKKLKISGVEIGSVKGTRHTLKEATKVVSVMSASAPFSSELAHDLGAYDLVYDLEGNPETGFTSVGLEVDLNGYTVEFTEVQGKTNKTLLTLSPCDITRFSVSASDTVMGLSFNITCDSQLAMAADFFEKNKTFNGTLILTQLQQEMFGAESEVPEPELPKKKGKKIEKGSGTRVDMSQGDFFSGDVPDTDPGVEDFDDNADADDGVSEEPSPTPVKSTRKTAKPAPAVKKAATKNSAPPAKAKKSGKAAAKKKQRAR